MSDTRMTNTLSTQAPKAYEFYCPGCRGRVVRKLDRAVRSHKSFCAKAGRETVMRRVKHPRK